MLDNKTTLADVVEKLSKPDSYLRGVLQNMSACKRLRGAAVVRIGVTGQGKAPHYRVQPCFTQLIDDDSGDSELYYKAYNGQSHRELDVSRLVGLSWSGSHMTIAEVQSLLAENRKK